MDLSILTLFIGVIRCGSFAAVARLQGVAPSSISRAIAGLEQELGIRLFQRNTRKLEPTEAELIYFEHVKAITEQLQTAQQMAMDLHQQPQGTLRVSVVSVFAQVVMAPLVAEFAKAYPSLAVELVLSDAYADLVEERIDVAIRLGSLQDSSYVAKRLASLEFYVCASPGYLQQQGEPKTLADISNHHCLLFPRPGYSLNWLFRDKKAKLTEIAIAGKYLATNSMVIKQFTVAGLGLALLPDWLVEHDIVAGKLVRLFANYDVTATDYDSAVWLLYPSREYLPLKARVFIDLLSAHFGDRV